jgi:pSer/pThr/pTyr-binding forkhead associated (FHA) protein
VKKTLTPIGEDLGIIIDKPILDLLGIDTDTLLEVKTDGTGLIIKPVGDGGAARPPLPEPVIEDDDLDLHADPTPLPVEPDVAAEPPHTEDDLSLPDEPALSSIPSIPSMEAALDDPPPEPEPGPKKSKKKKRRTQVSQMGSSLGGSQGTPVLVIEHSGEEVMRINLEKDQLVVGREADKVDLHLDDRALSRKHMRVEKRGAALWINDLGSANGTFVNGERVREPRRLEAGDVVEVGHYHLRVEGLEERDLSDTPVLTLNGPEGMHRFAMVGDQIVIGRSHSCDISIGHKSISRRHVRILAESGEFFVEDLGSQNGCKLNGKRLKGRAPFAEGDLVSMCDFSLELGYLEDQATDENPNRPRTMLIDKSVMAGAAYVDGDMQNMRSDAGHMQVGRDEAARPDTGEYSLPD